MTLDIGGRGPVFLDEQTPPFAFPGDVDVGATLLAGRVDDLNVMTRRGRYRAFVTRVQVRAPTSFAALGEVSFVVVSGGAGHAAGGALPLAEGDALRLEVGERVDVAGDTELALVVVDLWRA